MHLLGVALDVGERSVGLMLGAAVALYVAGRAAADATAGGRPPSGGRLAVGHWVPLAVVSAVAAAAGQFAVAVGLVFATAVGCLSLGLGTLAVVSPRPVGAPPAGRRTWPLLVPAGLLAMLAGFHRDVRPVDAIALAVEGVCVVALWAERSPAPPPDAEPVAVVPGRMPWPLRPVELLLAAGLAAVGAYLAIGGLTGAAAASEAATPGLLTATFLAPLAVLPILGSAADLTQRAGGGATDEAASGLVGAALLNACFGLPLVAAVAAGRARLVAALAVNPDLLDGWHDWPRWLGTLPAVATVGAATRPTVVAASGAVSGAVSATVPFPLAVWRVDVVAVIALAAAVVPVALGRWPLSRAWGVALIGAYVAYLVLSLRVGLANV